MSWQLQQSNTGGNHAAGSGQRTELHQEIVYKDQEVLTTFLTFQHILLTSQAEYFDYSRISSDFQSDRLEIAEHILTTLRGWAMWVMSVIM